MLSTFGHNVIILAGKRESAVRITAVQVTQNNNVITSMCDNVRCTSHTTHMS